MLTYRTPSTTWLLIWMSTPSTTWVMMVLVIDNKEPQHNTQHYQHYWIGWKVTYPE